MATIKAWLSFKHLQKILSPKKCCNDKTLDISFFYSAQETVIIIYSALTSIKCQKKNHGKFATFPLVFFFNCFMRNEANCASDVIPYNDNVYYSYKIILPTATSVIRN